MVDSHSQYAFDVSPDDEGDRVDRYLTSRIPDVSRAQVQRAADAGLILVDGTAVRSSHKIRAGEHVEVTLARADTTDTAPVAEDIPLDVVYEDDAIIIINKAAGMVVHPAVGHRTGTVVNALLGRGLFQDASETQDRPGIVHRLDKGTSGLMVCAKTELAHRRLADQLRDRTLSRTYLAIMWGHLKQDEMRFEGAIGRSNVDRKKMTVTERGRDATTQVRLLERFDLADYVAVKLETGRTHQIRVHLSHAGHPIVGDSDYGGGMARLKGIDPAKRLFARSMLKRISRPALHAAQLALTHPVSGERLTRKVPPPVDFEDLLELCRTPK